MAATQTELQSVKNETQEKSARQLFVDNYIATIEAIEKQCARNIVSHLLHKNNEEVMKTWWHNWLMLFYIKRHCQIIPFIGLMTQQSRFEKFFSKYKSLVAEINNLDTQGLSKIPSIIQNVHNEAFITELTKLHVNIEWELIILRWIIVLSCIALIVALGCVLAYEVNVATCILVFVGGSPVWCMLTWLCTLALTYSKSCEFTAIDNVKQVLNPNKELSMCQAFMQDDNERQNMNLGLKGATGRLYIPSSFDKEYDYNYYDSSQIFAYQMFTASSSDEDESQSEMTVAQKINAEYEAIVAKGNSPSN